MIEKFSDAAKQVLEAAGAERPSLKTNRIGTEHILIALTLDAKSIPAVALAGMGIQTSHLRAEAENLLSGNIEKSVSLVVQSDTHWSEGKEAFTDIAWEAVSLAGHKSRYLGQRKIEPEHLLLGVIDNKESGATRILEEQGANLTFLRRQVMSLLASQCCLSPDAPTLRSALIDGLSELIARHTEGVQAIADLADSAQCLVTGMPSRSEIAHMIFLAHMSEFLHTQVAFQRYLLEETLQILQDRAGTLDQELLASLISVSAQNLRQEVRSVIDDLWSRELRLRDQMLDEAEHDLIGSVIEDIWWAQSEELALHDLFDEALDDHRRRQVLNLQKRRIEITQRIFRLRSRLSDTMRQCFVKRSIPA